MSVRNGLTHLFRKLRRGEPGGVPASAGRHPVSVVFEQFRSVLKCNNRALERIADMGEKLGGAFLFDRHYIRTSVEALIGAVRDCIDALNLLDENRHQGLYEVHDRLTGQLEAIMAGHQDRSGPALIELDRVRPEHWPLVGGKNARLAEMRKDGRFAVPDGFVITTRVFHDLVAASGLAAELTRFEDLMAAPETEDAALEEARLSLVAGVLRASPPPSLQENLAARLEALAAGGPVTLAVRSSAEEEDMDFSFAGQFRSVLNVPAEPAAVVSAYLEVVASLFGERAVRYRRRVFPGEGRMSIAVGCQRMIDSVASGVAYSTDPRRSDGDFLLIAGALGQGEAVVEGTAPTDTFVFEKGEEPVPVERIVVTKGTERRLAAGGGLETRSLPASRQSLPCLTEEQLLNLARRVCDIERSMKRPVDVEWAFDRENALHILQARPLLLPGHSARRKALPEALAGYEALVAGQGTVAQLGIAAGPVFVVTSAEDLDGFPAGAVLVSRRDSSQFARVMDKAAAIVTELGTPVSHMATLCRELQVPCLVNVTGILTKVTGGMEITVDTEDRRIYLGRVPELLAFRAATVASLEASREFRLLRRVLQSVSRLNLIDPLLEDFSPEGCRTFHDILRFVHETAVIKLVDLGRDEHGLRRDRWARRLALPIPAGIVVLDIGGGLAELAPGEEVTFNAVTSVPFRAILQGMLFPGVWHRAAMPVGIKDLFSSMLNAPQDALSGQYSGHNIAIVSKEWVNLCFRFGYHFNIIDAHCDEVERDSHIYFRFLGGATDLTKRSRRSKLIGAILEALDFSVRLKGDMVIGRAGNMVRSEMARTLDLLGRLVGFTRQLDVRMDSDAMVERLAEAFLEGDYEVVQRS